MTKNIHTPRAAFIRTMLSVFALIGIVGTIKAQDSKVKVGEFDYRQYNRIEDRVFFLYELQNQGFVIEAGDSDGTVDIYAFVDESRAANDDDIDNYFAAVEQISQDWQPFSVMDRKSERVTYYLMNYKKIGDDVFRKVDSDFNRKTRENENNTCETAMPFCSDNGEYHFYPGVDSGSACGSYTTESCGQPYNNCTNVSFTHETSYGTSEYNGISTAPNPAFFFMRVGQPGDLDIYMEGHDTDGYDLDIDFVCWGPFASNDEICNISCDNMVDASYSPLNTEHCYINGAQTGEFYLLLITNYGNRDGEYFFENQGSGSTDCGIMEPGLESNSPICFGEVLTLSANDYSNADTYFWEGPDGWTSDQQNPYRPNATINMSGTYTCTITKDGESAVSEIEIQVLERPLASFEMTTTQLCAGEVVSFTNTSTTYPIGGTNNVYTWKFGDGYTANTDNATHIYDYPGTYIVRLTASAGGGDCEDVTSQTIVVEGATQTSEFVTTCKDYEWFGQTYSTTGVYQQHIPSDTDCGTTATLHLNIINDPHSEFEAVSCEHYNWNDIIYTHSGDYTQTFLTAHDCDSTVTMHLYIKDNAATEIYVEDCPGYIWDGQMYSISGDFVKTYAAANGCDSTVVMHFTAKDSPRTEIEVTACGSYDWDGIVYDNSGNYTHIYDAANECDSTVVMHLTVNELPNAYVTGDLWVAMGLQDSTTLTAWGGVDYLWNTGETTQSITVNPAIETLYYVTVTDENGCSKLVEVRVVNATGIEENTIGLDIYPNPTNSTINIEADGITMIRISDIVGQTMMERKANASAMQIDLNGLANGQYIIQVYTTNGMATRKIVKL